MKEHKEFIPISFQFITLRAPHTYINGYQIALMNITKKLVLNF